jgi:colanic acid/amylovoran biosynthesis glycosyltransferase
VPLEVSRRGRRLHLLEVGIRWPPETFLCWKLEGLADRGFRVTVASRSIIDASARLRGVELIALPRRAAPRARTVGVLSRVLALAPRAPLRCWKLVRGIGRLPLAQRERYGGTVGLLSLYLPLLSLNPDIIHFEWNQAAVLYLPMYGVWGRPVVVSCHGSELSADPHLPGHERFAELLPRSLHTAAAVHCVSESLRRAVLDMGVRDARSRVIRQGVDPAIFRPRAEHAAHGGAPLKVIMIGWPRWVKGFEWALQALRELADAGVPAQLEILGAGPDLEPGDSEEHRRLHHTVADLDLQEHVSLRGPVATSVVAERLRASDVLLLPSLDEGLPTVVLEAMASGIPVVASDCGGISEAITDGVEGLLISPRDASGLARALARLWRDPPLRTRMGQAGRRTVTARFTLERQLEAFARLYTELAGA